MRRWDGLVDMYMSEYGARGLAVPTVEGMRRELDRWGSWLKGRRPRLRLEAIDADQLVKYVSSRSAFRSKATVSGVMSRMRGFGDFLVREEVWTANPTSAVWADSDLFCIFFWSFSGRD